MTRQLLRRTAALGVAAAMGASALMALPSAPAAAATIGTLTFYIEAPYTPPFTLDSPYHAQTSAACPSTNFFMKLDGPGVPDDAGFAQGNTEGSAVGGINGGPFNFPVQNTLRSWATVNGFAGGQLPSGTYTYTLTCTDAFGASNEGEFVGQVKVSGNNVTSGPFSALGKAPVAKTKPKIKGTARVGRETHRHTRQVEAEAGRLRLQVEAGQQGPEVGPQRHVLQAEEQGQGSQDHAGGEGQEVRPPHRQGQREVRQGQARQVTQAVAESTTTGPASSEAGPGSREPSPAPEDSVAASRWWMRRWARLRGQNQGGREEEAPLGSPSSDPRLELAQSALAGLAVLALGFVVMITLVSTLQQSRDQELLYAQLREQLANAVAPVGPADADGALLRVGAPVALLSIPSLGLQQVVVEGTSSRATMAGPGHRIDTVLPGQSGTSVVFGRQAAYGGPFHDLGLLQPGDQVITTTGQGTATFAVLGVRMAGDPQPAPPAPGGARIVLTSATGTAYVPDGVIRVDAQLVSTEVDGSVSSEPFDISTRAVTGQLPPAEQPMGSDTSQLFALVLWSQALLLALVTFTWATIRWGRRQAWVAGMPVLLAVGLAVAISDRPAPPEPDVKDHDCP